MQNFGLKLDFIALICPLAPWRVLVLYKSARSASPQNSLRSAALGIDGVWGRLSGLSSDKQTSIILANICVTEDFERHLEFQQKRKKEEPKTNTGYA